MPKGKYERTEEIRQKISLACIGKYPTKETKQKLSIAKLGKNHPFYGKHRSKEVKEKLRLANLGKHHSEGTKEKMRLSHLEKNLGFHHTEETKRKISEAGKGRVSCRKGKTGVFSKETLEKMRIAHKGLFVGENSPSWRGGLSFEPYTPEFNKQLKELIRQRDGYQCQLCGMPECENIRKLSIHHIDYIKKNCLPDNLIALCGSCNNKVNANRDYWEEYFKEIMLKK